MTCQKGSLCTEVTRRSGRVASTVGSKSWFTDWFSGGGSRSPICLSKFAFTGLMVTHMYTIPQFIVRKLQKPSNFIVQKFISNKCILTLGRDISDCEYIPMICGSGPQKYRALQILKRVIYGEYQTFS